MNSLFWIIITAFLAFSAVSSGSRVIDLSDRFPELKGESSWLIMFYAPWCGHCKKLEPVWNHVAQTLFNTEVRIGRVDCTRFTSLAAHYKIGGFPTIMYVKGDIQEIFKGDRTKEEIVDFGIRMASPLIPSLDFNGLQKAKREHKLFFLYSGETEGPLWDSYKSLVKIYRHFHYFFSTDEATYAMLNGGDSKTAVNVYKDDSFHPFTVEVESPKNLTMLNDSLSTWINDERFPLFMRVTRGKLPQVWKVNKYLVLLVVEQNKIGTLKPTTPGGADSEQRSQEDDGGQVVDSSSLLSTVETLIRNLSPKRGSEFHFAWTGSPDLANSIAMKRLSLPALIVVNKSNMEYYEPPFHMSEIDPSKFDAFLASILDKTAQAQGGDSYLTRAYRVYFDSLTSLKEIWVGNPVLTTVLFGLPFGFLFLICYSIWCSDILDADDDESLEEIEPSPPLPDERKNHVKND